MLAMQYGFAFDDTFDMSAIRARVATIGDRFDGVPGLYCKAFMIAERARHGSNRYAPFYRWRDGAAMTDFLLSDAFRAVQLKFGRPTVRRWNEIVFIDGPAANETPRLATWEASAIAPDADLAVAAAAERAVSRAMASIPGLHSHFLGLDPEAWQWLRFSLWCTPPPNSVGGERLEVLRLTTPGHRAA